MYFHFNYSNATYNNIQEIGTTYAVFRDRNNKILIIIFDIKQKRRKNTVISISKITIFFKGE